MALGDSPAGTLCRATVDKIVKHFGLTEHLTLTPGNPPAEAQVRILSGGPIDKLVYIGMAFEPIGLDSHMVFAFTAPDSPVPHFTLDSVKGGEFFAFHLDLIPRADLGAELAYMDATLTPLTALNEQGNAIEGLTKAQLSPRQLAIMSPWMLAHRATEAAFTSIDPVVDGYLEHWFALVENGLPAEATARLSAEGLAERDRLNRASLFNPDVDPVWAQVDRLLGAETSAELRNHLATQGLS